MARVQWGVIGEGSRPKVRKVTEGLLGHFQDFAWLLLGETQGVRAAVYPEVGFIFASLTKDSLACTQMSVVFCRSSGRAAHTLSVLKYC